MGKKRGKGMMRFKKDPFYLYPLKDDMLGTHFVDRDEEIKIARGILQTQYEETVEICAVVGGIGVGKSSMLNYIGRLAEEMEYEVDHVDSFEGYSNLPKGVRSKRNVLLIDDIDKIEDERAYEFFSRLGMDPLERRIIFFTDTYDRSGAALHLRNHTVSHNISLPQRLGKDRLRFFLEERMKRCLTRGSAYKFPFNEKALEMASIRSRGNLRRFLNYAKHGWMVATGGGRDSVKPEELRVGMISIDRALLGGCDAIDMKILWYSTVGEMNKAYLSHKCGIDSKTMENRIAERIQEFMEVKRSGKEVLLSSIYKHMTGGTGVLTEIIKGLGFHMPEITDTKE